MSEEISEGKAKKEVNKLFLVIWLLAAIGAAALIYAGTDENQGYKSPSLKGLHEAPKVLSAITEAVRLYASKRNDDDAASEFPVTKAMLYAASYGVFMPATKKELMAITNCNNLAGIVAKSTAKNEVSYRLDKEVCKKAPGTEDFASIELSDDGSDLLIKLKTPFEQ